MLALDGSGEAGVRACIRLTARTSVALLIVVFPTSALRRRWPTPATGWLLRNRRYLGLSLAASHGYHLLFILALYAMGKGGDTSLATVYGGGFGFVMLAAMAATSNDASQRRLGRNWRRLHLLGIYTLWVVFAVSYLPAFGRGPIPTLLTLLLLAALVVRVGPARRAPSRPRRELRAGS